MALPSGTRIGPYEIADPIGSGGMGEVYRARDTRLGRNVAVKVLPSSFASDAERVRRFEQEAQAAGQVNHPNILAIYDVGSHDGSPYVVSELLDGQTLRELLTDGPLPIRKTIDYASQTALGLAAAHDRGIVHRDLKPDNLFLTPDGRVKILDFGLAKLVEPTVSGTSPSESKTILVDTQPGMVLGTVGYMSPEQVRGQPANHRADIFGLGAVLYEMISGTRAFGGDSAVETMNAILKQDPPELSGSQHDLPPILDGIVRRCLEKQPEQRFQSASDLAFALGAISGASGSGISGLEPATERSTRGGVTVAVRAALVIVAAIIGVAVGMNLTTPELIQPIFHRLTYSRGAVGAARLSADGRTIVYSAAWGRPAGAGLLHAARGHGVAAARPRGCRSSRCLGDRQPRGRARTDTVELVAEPGHAGHGLVGGRTTTRARRRHPRSRFRARRVGARRHPRGGECSHAARVSDRHGAPE